MSKRFLALAIFLLVVGVFSPAAAQDGNILRIDFTQELDTLNPIYTNMWFSTTAMDLYLSPPWFIDENSNPVPVLVTEIPNAENGGINEDGSVITLNLRDDITWSDGEPITSADFVFTYDMIMDPANTPSSRFPYDVHVKSVEAPNATTVVVTYNSPYAPWLTNLFQTTAPLPEHILQPVFDSEGTLDNAAWNRAPDVVSGPFLFEEWEPGSHMSFVRNDNYFGEPASLDGVFIRFVPEDATVVASLVSGDTDVGTFLAYGDTEALEESGNVNIVLVPSSYNEGWFFNVDPATAHPAMTDINVRKALSMAVDRDKINTDLNRGLTFTPGSYWQDTPYMRPDAASPSYDPEMAAQLLDEAGWVDSDGDGVRDKDGVKLELRFVTNQRQIRVDVQVIAQQALANIGVALTLENYPTEVFFASYADDGPTARGRYDIQEFSSSTAFPDPDVARFLCSEIASDAKPEGSNDQGYCNPQLDELLIEQSQTVDFDSRVALFHQIDQIITDDVIWVGVWYDPDLWAISNKYENTRVSGADPLWNIANWAIAS
jgi:peptide/nickel transport system substrate-binding protein